MTMKRQTTQMIAVTTVFEDAEPDELLQTFFAGNPVVTEHDCAGLTNSIISTVDAVIDEQICPDKSQGWV